MRPVRALLALLAVALLTLVLASAATASVLPSDGVIIRLKPGVKPPAGAVPLYGTTDTFLVRTLPASATTDRVSPTALHDFFTHSPDSVSVEYNPVVALDLPQPDSSPDEVGPLAFQPQTADPLFGQQYALTKMAVTDAWARAGTKGAGVTVAVLDSGVALAHPDLAGRLVAGYDFVNNDATPADDHGHGTHVAGIIAMTENSLGGVGVAPTVSIMPLKVLAANGSGSYFAIASALRYAADHGAAIANLSLGGPSGSDTLQQAVQYATGKGVVVIVAAGNSATAAPSYPAAYPEVIGVGATDATDRLASYSNYGVNTDLVAPGSDILSTMLTTGGNMTNPTGYGRASGTSMAAPNASGVAALLAAARNLRGSALRTALLAATDPLGDPTHYGAGRLNALRAVSPGPAPSPTAPPPPGPTPTAPPVTGDEAAQLIQLINAYRAQNGLAPLAVDSRLGVAGRFHTDWMVRTGCFSHTCPGEPDVLTRIRNTGFPLLSGGENIGGGYRTPQAMFDGWKASSGHNAAMLTRVWTHIGIGVSTGGTWGKYWAAEFASSSVPLPGPSPTALPAPTRLPPQPTIPPPPDRLDPAYTMTLRVPATAPLAARTLTRSLFQGTFAGVSYSETGWETTVVFDYALCPPIAPHSAYWEVYLPYQWAGVKATWTRKTP